MMHALKPTHLNKVVNSSQSQSMRRFGCTSKIATTSADDEDMAGLKQNLVNLGNILQEKSHGEILEQLQDIQLGTSMTFPFIFDA